MFKVTDQSRKTSYYNDTLYLHERLLTHAKSNSIRICLFIHPYMYTPDSSSKQSTKSFMKKNAINIEVDGFRVPLFLMDALYHHRNFHPFQHRIVN